MGHLNGLFAPRGGNLNKPIFKSSNARGVARGGGDVELSKKSLIKEVKYLSYQNHDCSGKSVHAFHSNPVAPSRGFFLAGKSMHGQEWEQNHWRWEFSAMA